MATTFVDFTGDGNATKAFSFPSYKEADIKVDVDGVVKTSGSHYNITSYTTTGGGNVVFTSGNIPSSPAAIRIYRDTDVDTAKATFTAGSAVKAADLNNNMTQILYAAQEEQNQTIQTTDLKDGAITSAKILDGTIATADIAADAITGAKIADDQINSEHYVDGSIDTAHIADSQVTTAKIAADAINGTKIADDSINSEHYVDGSIDTAHIADSQVTTAKIADANVTTAKITDLNVTTAKIAADAITGAKIADDAVDSEHLAADSIDAEHYAAGSVDTTALGADAVTGAKIADDAIDSEHYAADSIDAEHYAAASVDATALASNAVTTAKITDANVTTAKLAADSVTIAKIGCEQTTISDSDSHIPTSGAVVDYVAAQLAPIGGLEVIADDESFPNTIPSAGVVISISDAAGLQVNSSGVSTNADALDNSTITINGFPSELRGGVGSNPDPYVFQSGAGLMVQSTGSSHTYNYHQAMIRESDFVQLSDDINDFNNRYRVNAGEPGSSNDEGDLVYDTNANKMKVYDSSTSAWKEVTSTGDFKYLFLCPAGGTGAPTLNGSIATYDLRESSNSGSAASVSSAAQLVVSINGVVQKANTGTSAPAEGFALVDANTIIFGANLASGDSVFIVQIGSAVSIPTPGDGTVSAAKIASGAVTTVKIADANVTTAKIADDAVTAAKLASDAVVTASIVDANVTTAKIAGDAITGAKIADDAVGAEHIETLDANVDFADDAKARFGGSNQLELYYGSSVGNLKTTSGNLELGSAGNATVKVNGTESAIVCNANAAVDIYHNDSKTAWTHGSGFNIKGGNTSDQTELIITGNEGQAASILMSADDGDDNADHWRMYSNADNSFTLTNYTAGSYETNIKAVGNGAVELYYDNSKKFETASAGSAFTGGVSGNLSAASSASTITLDMSAACHHTVTLAHNTTFADPSNEVAGQSGSIIITQDGTGSRTAAWNSAWKWTGGTAPTLSTAANAVDRIDYLVVAAGNIHAVASLDVK